MSPSFGPSKFGGGMKAVDRPSRGVGRAATADLSAKRPKPKLKKVMPEVWKLIRPRRWLLFGSFLLIIVNRLCSLALPVSSRYLINNVMLAHQMKMLALDHRSRRWRHLHSGHYLLHAHTAPLHRRPAPHLRTAHPGPAAHRPPARRLLRRKPHRHPRRPHHDRRRRCPQSRRHRPARIRRRSPHRHHRLLHPHPHQRPHDAAHLCHPPRLRPHPAESLQHHPAHLPRTRQDQC